MAKKEKEPSDSDWVRLRRDQESKDAYFWEKLQRIGGWFIGALTALWAAFDAFTKLMEWISKWPKN